MTWTRVEDGLPEEMPDHPQTEWPHNWDHYIVLATVADRFDNREVVDAYLEGGHWYSWCYTVEAWQRIDYSDRLVPDPRFEGSRVVAWMPKPKPLQD